MPKETQAQKETIERVMHEFKHGELKGRDGRPVKNPRQAIAIGLSEAGASDRNTPEENTHNLAHTQAKERKGETAEQAAEGKDAMARNRLELYAEAKKRNVPGCSKMSKVQLERALAK